MGAFDRDGAGALGSRRCAGSRRASGHCSRKKGSGPAGLFLDGLLGAGGTRRVGCGPRRRLIRGRWEADALRDIVPDYVVEHFEAQHAVLVVMRPAYQAGRGLLRR